MYLILYILFPAVLNNFHKAVLSRRDRRSDSIMFVHSTFSRAGKHPIHNIIPGVRNPQNSLTILPLEKFSTPCLRPSFLTAESISFSSRKLEPSTAVRWFFRRSAGQDFAPPAFVPHSRFCQSSSRPHHFSSPPICVAHPFSPVRHSGRTDGCYRANPEADSGRPLLRPNLTIR